MRIRMVIIWTCVLTPAWGQSEGAAFFEKNIRPVLSGQCLSCHSSASRPVMGGLRLDDREAMLRGGSRGPAVVLGKAQESLLLRVLRHVDGLPKMPLGKKLADGEVAAFAQWVNMGAPWGTGTVASAGPEKFWAFVAPRDPPAPAVRNHGWGTSPVDAFLLQGLEAKELTPAPAADKRTLIRRASYDLTGLPPNPEQVRAFVADDSPDAFAKVVDRLLASPRYGERWGRHWLDLARYADSNGLDENLVYKNAWRYRDYVIQAFNKDKPYDQFIHEQLAGDLMPESQDLKTMYERWTATGFLSLGAKMLAEDDPVKMEMDIVDEQLDTAARTFLGLTVGCARCHDHKFDPIPTADYYALAGIFKSSKTMENFKVVAKWHEFVLAPKEDREKLAAHEARIEAKQKETGKITKAENEKLSNEARTKAGAYLMAAWDVERFGSLPLRTIGPGPGVVVRESGSFDAGNVAKPLEKKKANTVKGAQAPHFAEYRINVASAGEYQIETQDEERGRGTTDLVINGELVKRGAPPVENREASPDEGGWAPVGVFQLRAGENVIRLEHRTRFPYFEKLLVAPKPSGVTAPRTTVQIARRHGVNPSFLEQMVEHLERSKGAPASQLYAWERFGADLGMWTSPVAKLYPAQGLPDRASVAAWYQDRFQEVVLEKDPADAAKKALHEFLFEKFGPFRAPVDARSYYTPALVAEIEKLEKELKELEASTPVYPRAMGVREGDKIGDLPIHVRGSHWTLGEPVPRRFLSVIAGNDQKPLGEAASGRLELAQWLTGKDHPLTSRVMVNRIWRWHFGRGIVASVDNFGRLGEKPVNQPLLDWLAHRFIESGWSIKSMHRLIMLSSTYQMSSAYDARAAGIDPENRLQWRASRRRLEAEAIRDGVMAVSGDLDLTAGGSIMKYKDREYVANTSRRGDVDYDKNLRAVYIPVVRSSMYEVFTAFDLPDPSTPNGDRDSTVIAPQALFMMNGNVVLRHTRKMAESLLATSGPGDAERIAEVYERALSRLPTARETDQALTFLSKMETAFTGKADQRVLAWQSFIKALIGSNEFIYLN
ncbi:MAG: DUF1553 domain-containing protein [Acidobacteriia bacterium]|nr:DUF1553 domain-containing protein [Terriglobia bacterium]